MDKRRYLSRERRNPRQPIGMDSVETGKPAADGYSVRERKPLKREPFPRDSAYSEHYAAGSLMTEGDAMFREAFGDE